MLVFVIVKILNSTRNSESDFKVSRQSSDDEIYAENHVRRHHQPQTQKTDYAQKREDVHVKRVRRVNKPRQNPQNNPNVRVKRVEGQKPQQGINKSSGNIQFESNDLLDEYKK